MREFFCLKCLIAFRLLMPFILSSFILYLLAVDSNKIKEKKSVLPKKFGCLTVTTSESGR